MNPIIKYLYRNKLIAISSSTLAKWNNNRNVSNLLFAFECGDYKIRKEVLALIYSHKPEELEEILLKAINDPVYSVCMEAIKYLNEIDKKNQYTKLIKDIKSYWIQKLKDREKALSYSNTEFDPLWQKANSLKQNRASNLKSAQNNMSPPGGSEGSINL